MLKSRSVSISIAAPPQTVYEFASNPEYLPLWAPTFCKSVENTNGAWVIQTPDGPAMIEFADKNTLGVLDHTVTLASGRKFYSPMRVIRNGGGSEILFTLFQSPDMDEQKFGEDVKLIESDLRTLKRVLEARQGKQS